MKKNPLKQQRGAETLEFILVFTFFMILIMAVFDFARALYVWNALAEATRRGARVAAVCPQNQDLIVKRVATFDTINGSIGTSPVVKGLTTDAFTVSYYTITGGIAASDEETQFVEVKLNGNYQFKFIIPWFDQIMTPPDFKATLYSESKGAIPYYPSEVDEDYSPIISCAF